MRWTATSVVMSVVFAVFRLPWLVVLLGCVLKRKCCQQCIRVFLRRALSVKVNVLSSVSSCKRRCWTCTLFDFENILQSFLFRRCKRGMRDLSQWRRVSYSPRSLCHHASWSNQARNKKIRRGTGRAQVIRNSGSWLVFNLWLQLGLVST